MRSPAATISPPPRLTKASKVAATPAGASPTLARITTSTCDRSNVANANVCTTRGRRRELAPAPGSRAFSK